MPSSWWALPSLQQDALGVVVAVHNIVGLDLVDRLLRSLDGCLYGCTSPYMSTVSAMVRWWVSPGSVTGVG